MVSIGVLPFQAIERSGEQGLGPGAIPREQVGVIAAREIEGFSEAGLIEAEEMVAPPRFWVWARARSSIR